MIRRTKVIAVLAVSLATFMGAAEKPAHAITVELAKKCRALAIQAHPYKMPGEKGPGTATAQRDYFSQCVARGGNMPEENTSGPKSTGEPPAPPPAKQ
jgi:hypothetical protein